MPTKAVVPKGEGPTKPLSIRFPEKILKDIDRVASETNNDRTATIMHMLRWAVAEYKAQKEVEQGAKP